MSHEKSGSEKLKTKCRTMASLTPEQIAQVAGGYWQLQSFHLINGIPWDDLNLKAFDSQINQHF